VNQVALLLNPEQFPHNLFSKALTWAQQNKSIFRLIIITEEKFSVEHISVRQDVPDLDKLEPMAVEGHKINVIIHQVKYIRQQVMASGLQFSSSILVQPRIKDVLDEIRFADVIFMEFRRNSSNSSFDWSELFHYIPMHKQVISNKVHG
jgi:hypothetical protein